VNGVAISMAAVSVCLMLFSIKLELGRIADALEAKAKVASA